MLSTHSPILMAYPQARTYQCSAEGLVLVTYEDTEHYQITRDFLLNVQLMLRELLKR